MILKRFVSFFLSLIIALSTINVLVYAKNEEGLENIYSEDVIVSESALAIDNNTAIAMSETSVQFAGGDGSEKNPYQIATAEQLNAIRYDLDANYELVNDIDLTKYSCWLPVGDKDNKFIGTLNGNNYVVSNIVIDRNNCQYAGLFGYTMNSTIKNIFVKNVDIIAIKEYTEIYDDGSPVERGDVAYSGSIVAFGNNVILENCISEGKVKAISNLYKETFSGGIAGYLCGESQVNSCSFTGNVIGDSPCAVSGGIVGDILSRNIINCIVNSEIHCFATNDVSGD